MSLLAEFKTGKTTEVWGFKFKEPTAWSLVWLDEKINSWDNVRVMIDLIVGMLVDKKDAPALTKEMKDMTMGGMIEFSEVVKTGLGLGVEGAT